MDQLLLKSGGWFALAVVALLAVLMAVDSGFAVHMGIEAAGRDRAGRTAGRADLRCRSAGEHGRGGVREKLPIVRAFPLP